MNIIFRVDASIDIGLGHLMRCISLSSELANRGASCKFVVRKARGNFYDQVINMGFDIDFLPEHSDSNCNTLSFEGAKGYSSWLGVDSSLDASQTLGVIEGQEIDLLIVDHYGIDFSWEKKLNTSCKRLMVIDDLANRSHDCDVLLDQTYGRSSSAYTKLVSKKTKMFVGSEYALLRPQFYKLRSYSLSRRRNGKIRHVVISLGGVDKFNLTTTILDAIKGSSLEVDCKVSVVVGVKCPWINRIYHEAVGMPWRTEVFVGLEEMAELLSECDLVIGAAGGSSWERACLGVPTILVVAADNQREIAKNLEQANAVIVVDMKNLSELIVKAINYLLVNYEEVIAMSIKSSNITSGNGANIIANYLMDEFAYED